MVLMFSRQESASEYDYAPITSNIGGSGSAMMTSMPMPSLVEDADADTLEMVESRVSRVGTTKTAAFTRQDKPHQPTGSVLGEREAIASRYQNYL